MYSLEFVNVLSRLLCRGRANASVGDSAKCNQENHGAPKSRVPRDFRIFSFRFRTFVACGTHPLLTAARLAKPLYLFRNSQSFGAVALRVMPI